MGNPRVSSSSQDRFRDKLEGKYSWPFSITLPSSVTFTEKQMKEFQVSGEERLPPSLKATGGFSFIDYQVVVEVKRSGAFRSGSSYVYWVLRLLVTIRLNNFNLCPLA